MATTFNPGDNPIATVDGVTMPIYPDSEDGYKWELEDASASDSGRTEDVVMHKKRIGQTDAVTLKFSEREQDPENVQPGVYNCQVLKYARRRICDKRVLCRQQKCAAVQQQSECC